MQQAILHSVHEMLAQVERALQDLPEALQNDRIHASAMSPVEVLEHLLQVRHAVETEIKGEKYDWSQPFSSGIDGLSPKLEAVKARTAELLAKMDLTQNSIATIALDYFAAHDSYHVGQLCQLRMARQPEWDPYSIYQH